MTIWCRKLYVPRIMLVTLLHCSQIVLTRVVCHETASQLHIERV